MSKNRGNIQINLLPDEENTKMLQMLKAICEHRKLAFSEVLSELREHLPPPPE